MPEHGEPGPVSDTDGAQSRARVPVERRYLRCVSRPECTGTNFAVVVDGDGNIVRFECQRCGGTEVRVGPDAT